MRDDELRRLERLVRESPDDPAAWARYVQALDRSRALAPDELSSHHRIERVRYLLAAAPGEPPAGALVDPGDEVLIQEHDAPKIAGPWRGRVLEIRGTAIIGQDDRPQTWQWETSLRVRPLALDDDVPEIAWRTAPEAAWLRDGLTVLPPLDRIELIARAPRPSTPPPPAQ